MPSRRRKRTDELLTCTRSWRLCSTARTRARAKTPPPFPQPSCASRLSFERAVSGREAKDAMMPWPGDAEAKRQTNQARLRGCAERKAVSLSSRQSLNETGPDAFAVRENGD